MAVRVKKYGARGTRPPATYDSAIVSALARARPGSGRSSPSSKRIMKSTQASGLSRNASRMGVVCSEVSPYSRNTSATSAASTTGFSRTSSHSRARSLA